MPSTSANTAVVTRDAQDMMFSVDGQATEGLSRTSTLRTPGAWSSVPSRGPLRASDSSSTTIRSPTVSAMKAAAPAAAVELHSPNPRSDLVEPPSAASVMLHDLTTLHSVWMYEAAADDFDEGDDDQIVG